MVLRFTLTEVKYLTNKCFGYNQKEEVDKDSEERRFRLCKEYLTNFYISNPKSKSPDLQLLAKKLKEKNNGTDIRIFGQSELSL